MIRALMLVPVLSVLAGCAGGDTRYFAHAYPYEEEGAEFLAYDPHFTSSEAIIDSRVRGVIDDDHGLQGGDIY